MGTENTQAVRMTSAPAQAEASVDYAAIAKAAKAIPEPTAEELEAAKRQKTETGGEDTGEGDEDEAPAVPPAAKTTPEKPVEPPPAQKSELEVSFEKLVAKQQELRKEAEVAKPGIELANTIGVQNAQALAKAIVSKNPLDALAAIGFSYTDVANAVIGKGGEKKPAAPQKPPEQEQPKNGVPVRDPEVEAMLREHRAQKARQEQQAVESKIRELVKANPKLELVNKLDAGTGEVVRVIEEMFVRGGGKFPTSTIEETIRIAAEEAESRLLRQKEQWSKVLTVGEKAATVSPTTATETPKPAQDGGGKTLTNSLSAPAGSAPSADFDIEAVISKFKNDPNLPR